MTATRRILRGRILSFADDPAKAGASAYSYIEDGAIVVGGGKIETVGEAGPVLAGARDLPVADWRPGLILPGFIDAHLHFPQTRVIASYGAQLIDWLNKYTFVEEQKFADAGHAEAAARFFFDELFANGTTTAVAFCSVHPQSVDAFFSEAERRGARMIAGKVMMDRHAPAPLTDTAESGYRDSETLIGRWHGRGRLGYAISPRFAITSTPAQLDAAGALARKFPDCHVQTHLSENRREIAWVRELFPQAASYTDVYARHGLLGPRSLFGHCIHLGDDERRLLGASGSVAVFCPTSNLFLGSGLFDLGRTEAGPDPVRVALASDIGAGTSYSMLRTVGEAYKVLQLQGQALAPLRALYLATLGNARALSLADRIGRIAPGWEADLVVLDACATPAMAHRMETVAGLEEEAFVLTTLGARKAVRATYVAGEVVAERR